MIEIVALSLEQTEDLRIYLIHGASMDMPADRVPFPVVISGRGL